ncbi:MAG TPA: LuxR C-terminal-related transcriptional regulator [Actinomycetaceae bacterium]|nr:LuxR C-terminal-related transcriptional regulator [Actinomycetaceae bacterium]
MGLSGDFHDGLARRAVDDELLRAVITDARPCTVLVGAPGNGMATLVTKRLPALLQGDRPELLLFPSASALAAEASLGIPPPPLVVGCRDLDELPAWLRTLPATARHVISVGPLARSELHDFLQSRLGATIDTSTARILGTLSGYIPAVLTTMIRVLREAGTLVEMERVWTLTGAVDPGLFQQQLRNMLTRLPPGAKELFYTLCVLDSVAPRELGARESADLAPLLRAGLVEQRDDQRYAVRAPLYAEVGERLADPVVAARLRRDALRRAQPPPRAVRQALEHRETVSAQQVRAAVAAATGSHDWDLAFGLVTRGLVHPVSTSPDAAAVRAELIVEGAFALRFLDEPDEALAQLAAAEAAAEELPAPARFDLTVRIAALRAEILHYKFGEVDEALDVLRRAARSIELPRRQADLVAQEILHLIHAGRFRAAATLRQVQSERLHQADQPLRQRIAIAHTLALCAQGRSTQALTGVRKLAVKSLLPRRRTSWVVEELSAAYFVAAFRSAGPAVLPRLMRQFESPDAAQYHPDDTTYQLAYSSWFLARGAVREAHTQIRACIAALEFHDPSGLAVAVAALGAETAALQGQRHVAQELIRTARSTPPRSSAVIAGGASASLAAAELLLNVSGAQARLLEVARSYAHEGAYGFAAQTLHAGVRFGRRTSARELLALAPTLEGELCALHVAHARAVCDGDELALLAAAERYREHGLMLHAAETFALVAHTPGASDAIRRRARHGAAQLLEAIGPVHHPFLSKLATPQAPTLTKREREINEFIAHGLSNREIAERLGLSVRTVEGHVARLYQKTRQTRRDPARRTVATRPR